MVATSTHDHDSHNLLLGGHNPRRPVTRAHILAVRAAIQAVVDRPPPATFPLGTAGQVLTDSHAAITGSADDAFSLELSMDLLEVVNDNATAIAHTTQASFALGFAARCYLSGHLPSAGSWLATSIKWLRLALRANHRTESLLSEAAIEAYRSVLAQAPEDETPPAPVVVMKPARPSHRSAGPLRLGGEATIAAFRNRKVVRS